MALWVSGGSVGQASIRLARVGLVEAFSLPTDPTALKRHCFRRKTPQVRVPYPPLDRIAPPRTRPQTPAKQGFSYARAKWLAPPCEATRQPARRQVVGSASVFQSTITHRNAPSRLEGISPEVDGSARHFYSPSSLDRKRALRDVQATLCDPPGESHAHRQ